MVAGAPQSSSARGKARASTRETMVQPSQAQEPPDSKDKGSSSKVRSCHKCAATLNRNPRKDGSLPAFSYCTTCCISYHTTDCGFRFLRGSLAPTPEALQACPKCSGVCLCCGGPVKCHAGSLRLKRRKPQPGSEGTKDGSSPESCSWEEKPLKAELDTGTYHAPERFGSGASSQVKEDPLPSEVPPQAPPQAPPLPAQPEGTKTSVKVPWCALQQVLSAIVRVVGRQQAQIGELNQRLAEMGSMFPPDEKGKEQGFPVHTWATIDEGEKTRYIQSLKADLVGRLKANQGADQLVKAESPTIDLQGMLAPMQGRGAVPSPLISSRAEQACSVPLPHGVPHLPVSGWPPALSADLHSLLPELTSISGRANATAQLQGDSWAAQVGVQGGQAPGAVNQATLDMELVGLLLADQQGLGLGLGDDLLGGPSLRCVPPLPDLSQGSSDSSMGSSPSHSMMEGLMDNTAWPDAKRTKCVYVCEHAVPPPGEEPLSLAKAAALLAKLNTTITKLGRQIVMLCSAIIVFEIAVGLAHNGFFSRALGLPWADSLVAVPADTPYCLWILALVVNLLLGSLGVRQGDTVFFRSMTYPGVHQVYAAGLFLKELFALYVLGSNRSSASDSSQSSRNWGRPGLLLAAFAALTHTIRAFRQYLCQVAILLDSLQRPARPLPAPRQLQTPPAAPEYCQVIAPPQAPKVTSTPFALDCDVKRIGEELFALPSREARRHHMRHLLLLLAKLQMHEYSLQVQEAYQLGKPPPDSRRQRALGKLPPMLK